MCLSVLCAIIYQTAQTMKTKIVVCIPTMSVRNAGKRGHNAGFAVFSRRRQIRRYFKEKFHMRVDTISLFKILGEFMPALKRAHQDLHADP